MFSPDLFRYIIDPEKETEQKENRKVSVEKHVFCYSILDQEKIMSDYNFLFRILHNFNKTFDMFISHFSKHKAVQSQK